jgi:phosphoglycolate phosphatase-like HAD superfamily hydrolase
MIKALMFDFDGVLVESVDIKTGAFAKLFEKEPPGAVKMIVDYHMNNTGVSRFDKFRYIYKNILKRDLSEKEFAGLCSLFSGIVMDEVVNAPYVNGAQKFLAENNGKYLCFVVSATPEREMKEIVRRRAMSHYFKYVYGSPRPKEEIVREILKKWSLPDSCAVYLGDSMSDYNAATANNVKFIARIGGGDDIFKDVGCIKIRDLSGLRGIMDKIDNHEDPKP